MSWYFWSGETRANTLERLAALAKSTSDNLASWSPERTGVSSASKPSCPPI